MDSCIHDTEIIEIGIMKFTKIRFLQTFLFTQTFRHILVNFEKSSGKLLVANFLISRAFFLKIIVVDRKMLEIIRE